MAYVVAGLIVVFVLCAFDLVLTLGVVRRLREHTELLGKVSIRESSQETLPVGATVAPFNAITVDGQPISREMLETPTVVGLVSASCDSCQEQLPRFLEYAAAMPRGRAQVLAIVVGSGRDADETARRLASVARVVMEEPFGRVAAAFGATLFPAAYVIEEGYVVAASAKQLDALPDQSAASSVPAADR